MQVSTVPELARQLRISADKVRALIARGELAAINVSLSRRPRWRITAEAVEAFIRARSATPKPRPTRRKHQPVGRQWF